MAMCSAIRCVSAALPLLTRPAHIWTCQNSLRPNVLRTLYTSSRLSGGKNFTELRGSSVSHLAFSFAARTAAIPVCILFFMHFYFKCSSLLNAEVCFWTEFVLGFNVLLWFVCYVMKVRGRFVRSSDVTLFVESYFADSNSNLRFKLTHLLNCYMSLLKVHNVVLTGQCDFC